MEQAPVKSEPIYMEHQGTPSPQFPQEPPRSDVDEILRRKRKAREYKACYPCRQRKVKCDQQVPCKTCVVREHPELCTYHPPSENHPPAKRQNAGNSYRDASLEYQNGAVLQSNSGPAVTLSQEEWERVCSKLSSVEKSLAELKNMIKHASGQHGIVGAVSHSPETDTPLGLAMDSESRHISSQGIHTQNDLTGQTVHLGGSSVAALVLALGRGEHDRPEVQELLGKSILPIFGLDNENATYPFVDLWGLPHGAKVHELARTLPSDSECMSFFRYYREIAHVVYPAVADVETFESELLLFLLNRASSQPGDGNDVTDQSIYGKSLHWASILFAALASGCQCSSLPRKERELTSQVYVCCSLECLRLTNFLSSPTLETIQSLLVIGNVISNNMNAGVAWSMLGLTVRLAQTLGLHRRCPASFSATTRHVKSRIWWAICWQESLISISYDRASSEKTIDYPIPRALSSTPGSRPFDECMYRVCKVGLDIVRDRARPQKSNEALLRITEYKKELQEIMADAADYLKDSRRCRSTRDQIEHWVLYLHLSYNTSELCRPAISPTAEYDLSRTHRQTCIDNLANTVEAFLGLQNVTVYATRSWAAVHRSLSSALLLGILGEPSRNARALSLLNSVIAVLSEVTAKVDPAELSAPITRSLSALRKLITQPTSATHHAQNATGATPITSSTSNDSDAPFSFDEALISSYSPSSVLAQDTSPYTLMGSILWGSRETP